MLNDMFNKLFILFVVCIFLISGACRPESKKTDEGALLLLAMKIAQLQPACPGQSAVRFRNGKSSAQTLQFFSDSTCLLPVGNSSGSLNPGETGSYQCFSAGSYYINDSAVLCSSNTATLAMNRNYTMSTVPGSFQQIPEN